MTRRPSMLRPGIRRLLGLDVARKERIAAELEDELQLHLDLRAEQLQRLGMSRETAVQQARLKYGSIDETTRDIHDYARRQERTMQRRISFDSLQQDIRFALRTLGRSKAWTAIAIVTLALGIGASTAVFSVVNDLLLDPLRYPHSDRLVLISRSIAKSGLEVTPPMEMLEAWKSARTFEAIEGVASDDYTLSSGGEPVMVNTVKITSTFPAFAGARLISGRSFEPNEGAVGAPPVAMLSEHVWRSRFGSADMLGKTIVLENTSRTIVGVVADGVRLPTYSSDAADVWIPRPVKAFLSGPAIGRLKPGVTMAQAEQELRAISAAVPSKKSMNASDLKVTVREPGSRGQVRSSVYLLAGAVCLLMLIACANVAHLLIARGATRERELSIRAALGAGRSRIVRQLVTESLILAGAGCVAGIGFGMLALRAIVALRPENMSELARVHVDARVVIATVGLSVVTGIVFGLIAGFSGRGGRSFEALRASAAGTADRHTNRLRGLLVITENALSVVLLVGATLLVRTVINLYSIDPGFDATNMYAMSVNLPDTRYGEEAPRRDYAERLLAGARRIPGVTEATIASGVPTKAGVMIGNWEVESAAPAASDGGGFTAMNTVAPEYFRVMRMKLLNGRDFDAQSATRSEVIVSRGMAKQLWGSVDVVGRRLRQGTGTWSTVAAVAPDAALLSLPESGTPAMYFPAAPAPEQSFALIFRAPPGSPVADALRKLSLSLDPTISPPPVISVRALLLRTVASQRFIMALLTVFAMMAVILSAIGLYGVITYMVSQSTREIGVRVALGAARRDVVQLIMRQGLTLSIAGLGIGLVASMWGTKLLRSSLYGVTATDPLSYVAGAVVIVLLAVVACAAPTIRAVRIDPMVAMRGD